MNSAVGLAAGPEVAILDEGGALLPQGEVGEVAIRGPNVTPGYDNNPDANARAFTDGWFRTGDVARMDAEGRVFYVGRTKDMIRRSGENIVADEVERALQQHPAVRTAAVLGVPDELRGEEVKALVVLAEGETATAEEIIAHCRTRLAGYKAPKRVEFRDELARTATGKIQKFKLREPFWSSTGGRQVN